MLLLMLERRMPIDMVLTADTGMEFPEMYEHLAKLDEHLYRERGSAGKRSVTSVITFRIFYKIWRQHEGQLFKRYDEMILEVFITIPCLIAVNAIFFFQYVPICPILYAAILLFLPDTLQ